MNVKIVLNYNIDTVPKQFLEWLTQFQMFCNQIWEAIIRFLQELSKLRECLAIKRNEKVYILSSSIKLTPQLHKLLTKKLLTVVQF